MFDNCCLAKYNVFSMLGIVNICLIQHHSQTFNTRTVFKNSVIKKQTFAAFLYQTQALTRYQRRISLARYNYHYKLFQLLFDLKHTSY